MRVHVWVPMCDLVLGTDVKARGYGFVAIRLPASAPRGFQVTPSPSCYHCPIFRLRDRTGEVILIQRAHKHEHRLQNNKNTLIKKFTERAYGTRAHLHTMLNTPTHNKHIEGAYTAVCKWIESPRSFSTFHTLKCLGLLSGVSSFRAEIWGFRAISSSWIFQTSGKLSSSIQISTVESSIFRAEKIFPHGISFFFA